MTLTVTVNEPTSTAPAAAGTWDAAFAALKARYPTAKDSIVFCMHALQNCPDIGVDDLKAQAAMHNIRVTAASVTAAKRLMSPEPARATAPAATTQTVPAPAAAPAVAERPRRRVRAPAPEVDAEALIRQVVGRLQTQSSAEADKLRDAMRKAISLLQTAVG